MTFPRAAPSVSVVICTYSDVRVDQLTDVLAGLQRQTVAPHQVVVVVDHNPELLERLRKLVAGAMVVPNRETQGLSGSRNSGIAVSTGDVIAFIDDDAIPNSDWIEAIAGGYAHERTIGVGGPVDPIWEGDIPWWFPAEFGWVVGCSFAGQPTLPSPIRNFIGCNMSFRRDAISGVRGFRIELGRVGLSPVGCEETEFCIRLLNERPADILWFDPAARVRHHVPEARLKWAYFTSRCWSEGRSKARVARLVGAERALASEKSYVGRVLTSGIRRYLWNAIRGDRTGVAKASALVAGFVCTLAGYAAGHLEAGRDVQAPALSGSGVLEPP